MKIKKDEHSKIVKSKWILKARIVLLATMKTELTHFPNIIVIGLVGKVSTEAGCQLCYPGDNITDSKLNLKVKTIRKQTLDFLGWILASC